MSRFARSVFFAISCAVAAIGCSEAADPICNRLYDDCRGALLDKDGAAVSKERCLRILNKLADEQSEQFAQLERCFESSSCDDLAACFTP
jgi:hypothetical protein